MRREPDLAARSMALLATTVFTQINYLANPVRELHYHIRITSVELLWLISAFVFERLTRMTGRPERVRSLWIVADVTLLTILLGMLDAASSSLIVGYPLVIAASGLWSRVGYVWVTTIMAMAGYSVLAFNSPAATNHRPNIVLASILITGCVVAHQVKRIWALSSYYEHGTAERS
jgi:serine/threonine-protein kinase